MVLVTIRPDDGDQFPLDSTQWNDTDNDGYGDNSKATILMPVHRFTALRHLIDLAA
ncbi:MAG: hypothetical protein CM15mP47_5090 [Methanobacteriota archaeon]|nr:MAG: hypothetical protein CM15mP47_5090 [Euryarchaeota archaeon]